VGKLGISRDNQDVDRAQAGWVVETGHAPLTAKLEAQKVWYGVVLRNRGQYCEVGNTDIGRSVEASKIASAIMRHSQCAVETAMDHETLRKLVRVCDGWGAQLKWRL